MAVQWHPLFAQLLRPLVQGYYEVDTDVPVGDVPRQADLVLLRRMARHPLPFRGLWRHLTTWNVLEYKGPLVSARLEHLDLLVELGLGIHRRLNEERRKLKQKPVPAEEVSLWYLTHRVGRRFLKVAVGKLGSLEALTNGIWRGLLLGRPVFLVSGRDLPMEAERVPFHLLEVESPERSLTVARLIVQQPSLWELYSQFVGSLHPDTLQELQAMARVSKKGPQFHLKPLADLMGMKEVINQLGLKEIIAEAGAKKIIDEMGVKKVIDEMGVEKIISEMLSHMSAAERADLRRRLDQSESRRK